MELQTKDNRNFTNQLPRWAIGCHIGLIFILLLISIGAFVLSAIQVLQSEIGFSLLFLGVGVTFLGFARFGYKNLRKYRDLVINIQLGETGYDYYAKDKKKGEEHHTFLPYENMKYVLIGMDYRLKAKSRINSGENFYVRTKFVPVRSAKVIIYGVDSNNQVKVSSFPHAEEKSLLEWVDVFQKNGVKIFHSDKALTATPSNPDVIDSIPKEPFDGTLSFVIGSEAEGLDDLYLTEEQQKLVKEKEKQKQKNGLLFTVLLSVAQVLMICFWFPNWDIVQNAFSTSSDEFFALLFTVLVQFFIYANKRRVKWYEPLRDMGIIYVGILLGLLLSPDNRPNFHSAVQTYAMMTIGAFLFFFYVIKVSSWFKKLGKKVDKMSQ